MTALFLHCTHPLCVATVACISLIIPLLCSWFFCWITDYTFIFLLQELYDTLVESVRAAVGVDRTQEGEFGGYMQVRNTSIDRNLAG